MIMIKGRGVCGGIAFGRAELLTKSVHKIERIRIADTDAEIKKFETACKAVKKQLKELYEKAKMTVGEENAQIFEIHSMMLDDEDFLELVKSNIEAQNINAESAVAAAADSFAETFKNMDDSYMQARAADVTDVSERLISVLAEEETKKIKSEEPVIIGAEDLAPSETVQLDKSKILAFVTEQGSANSHTSILARTMNIPAVIGAEGFMESVTGDSEIIVDGFSGEIYINPDMDTILKLQKKKQMADEQNKLLIKLKGMETKTLDGQKVLLYANIGSVEDMTEVYANDAMGVGLFRSEFLYLESDEYPSEDKQFSVYKSVAQKALGKRVIIRTLDIGADKQAAYFQLPKEENPAMGVRAIRICLSRPEVFKTQLRALYRASVFGKIAIMFPMITSVNEIVQIKQICTEVKNELKSEKLAYDEKVELGIMIETPAAAIISDKLSEEVDFFSIGTNDLTQYTLAIDRQNAEAERFLDIHHLAVLRMIKTITDNAHRRGIWSGICGELAGDMKLTELFLAIGVDELSVSPGQILPLKQKILNLNIGEIKKELLEKLK